MTGEARMENMQPCYTRLALPMVHVIIGKQLADFPRQGVTGLSNFFVLGRVIRGLNLRPNLWSNLWQ